MKIRHKIYRNYRDCQIYSKNFLTQLHQSKRDSGSLRRAASAAETGIQSVVTNTDC